MHEDPLHTTIHETPTSVNQVLREALERIHEDCFRNPDRYALFLPLGRNRLSDFWLLESLVMVAEFVEDEYDEARERNPSLTEEAYIRERLDHHSGAPIGELIVELTESLGTMDFLLQLYEEYPEVVEQIREVDLAIEWEEEMAQKRHWCRRLIEKLLKRAGIELD